jgi:hypothetical protein
LGKPLLVLRQYTRYRRSRWTRHVRRNRFAIDCGGTLLSDSKQRWAERIREKLAEVEELLKTMEKDDE